MPAGRRVARPAVNGVIAII